MLDFRDVESCMGCDKIFVVDNFYEITIVFHYQKILLNVLSSPFQMKQDKHTIEHSNERTLL